ncbi:hypothetical protein C7443_107146 [Plasticicumulans acidivorans]|uniref:Uncharacterized protein n=1 Tax=Plasticicumulans acidivorans TaxID=886464 RepID=A0A317MU30_9GAMM|nr:hypothetical protein C7443_107146 [Plasticicumulans acidivorans]
MGTAGAVRKGAEWYGAAARTRNLRGPAAAPYRAAPAQAPAQEFAAPQALLPQAGTSSFLAMFFC